MRPGKWERRKLLQLSGRCLDDSRSLRLSRRRLDNLQMRQIELAHLENVAAREAPPKLRCKILRKAIDQALAVSRPLIAILFFLHNPATNLPVRRRNDGIDRSRRSSACDLKQFDDTGTKPCVRDFGLGSPL